MTDRAYVPTRGFQIEGQTFAQHQRSCPRCGRFDEEKPATLALLCLDGSVLWKKDNTVATERDSRPLSPYHAPAKEVRKLMRYK